MHLFESARIKLTAWYLLIIMAVSLFFSLVIYVGVSRELKQGFRRAEIRLKAEELDIPLPPRFSNLPENLPPGLREAPPRFFLAEDLEAVQKRLALNLVALNGFILVFSAGAAYFLAGRTLQPIEEALEEQKRFVADASHELRTPLTALKASIEVGLRDKRLTLKEARTLLKSSLEEVDSLGKLTNSLLSLTRYQQRTHLSFEKVSIKEALAGVQKKMAPLAHKRKINLEVRIVSQKVEANRQMFEELLLIFLDNAIKFTPKGGKVILKTKLANNRLVIQIKDTGIGLSKDELPNIFDRFYQADESRTKDGFGLGLSLAKRIVELHHSSIEVASQLGQGTTFTVKLPLKQA